MFLETWNVEIALQAYADFECKKDNYKYFEHLICFRSLLKYYTYDCLKPEVQELRRSNALLH